ncbi:MAG: hypothetical protein AAB851_03555 [Patescibacteria group bacterium]
MPDSENFNLKSGIKNDKPISETPFILKFQTYVEGAMGGTTSGTWTDVDGMDAT